MKCLQNHYTESIKIAPSSPTASGRRQQPKNGSFQTQIHHTKTLKVLSNFSLITQTKTKTKLSPSLNFSLGSSGVMSWVLIWTESRWVAKPCSPFRSEKVLSTDNSKIISHDTFLKTSSHLHGALMQQSTKA